MSSSTSLEEIRRLVQELYAAWSLHQLEKIDAIFTSDAAYEDVAAGQVNRGKEEIKQLLRAAYAWAPDFRLTMKSLIVATTVLQQNGSAKASRRGQSAISLQVATVSACTAPPSSLFETAK